MIWSCSCMYVVPPALPAPQVCNVSIGNTPFPLDAGKHSITFRIATNSKLTQALHSFLNQSCSLAAGVHRVSQVNVSLVLECVWEWVRNLFQSYLLCWSSFTFKEIRSDSIYLLSFSFGYFTKPIKQYNNQTLLQLKLRNTQHF